VTPAMSYHNRNVSDRRLSEVAGSTWPPILSNAKTNEPHGEEETGLSAYAGNRIRDGRLVGRYPSRDFVESRICQLIGFYLGSAFQHSRQTLHRFRVGLPVISVRAF